MSERFMRRTAAVLAVSSASLLGGCGESDPRVAPPLSVGEGIEQPVGGGLQPASRSQIVEAPRDALNVPAHIQNYLNNMTVSIHGTCSGYKIMINNKLAGVVGADHCMPTYDRTAANPTLPTYGLQIRTGSVAYGTSYLIADDLVTYPDSDLAFLAFPGFTANQVAQEYFRQNQDFDWNAIPTGSPIYFAGYPYSFENPTSPYERPRQVFATSYIGTATIPVYLSTVGSQVRNVNVVGTTMNLTQSGYGCLGGSSGSIGVYFDSGGAPHHTGALTGFSTLSPGRETIVNNVVYTPEQAIEKQFAAEERWGLKPMGDLVCSFSDPRTPGPQVNIRFINGR